MRLTAPPGARALVRLTGLAALAGALTPPVHAAAERWFAAHMLQHEALVLLAAPLLALGWPPASLLAALPRAARRRVARAGLARLPWRAATSPAGAFVLHGLALWAWHVPPLFDAAVTSDGVHALEHATLLGTALLFWWSLLAPGVAGYGAAVASVFGTALHTSALGALLTFVPAPLYRVYANPHALEDQQLAGLVMWVPGGAILVGVGVALAAAWLRQAERRSARADADLLLAARAGEMREP